MNGLDEKKKPGSVDEVLDQRVNILINIMNSKLEDIYKDFNLAMSQKNLEDQRLENRLTNMVNVMWGLINEQRIRLLTLEDFILKNNVGSADALSQDYLENIAKFKEASGWEEIPLADLADAQNINPLDTVGSLTPQREDLHPEKPF